MEVLLTRKQQKLTKDLDSLRRVFGDSGVEIAACLELLAAADNLNQLCSLPPTFNHRCHELRCNLKNLFSMDLKHPYRLLFRPALPIPRLSDNGLDRAAVRTVEIKELYTDTHD